MRKWLKRIIIDASDQIGKLLVNNRENQRHRRQNLGADNMNRSELIIDTNVLYYLYGLSIPPSTVSRKSLLKKIDSENSVKISSVSFAEFLTKYRRHAGMIRRVCSFMRQHHICISSDEYIPITPQATKVLAKIKQYDFNKEFDRMLERKIYVESRYASIIFFLVLICATIFECDIYPYTLSAPVYDFLAAVFKPANKEIFVPLFHYTYREAYKTDDVENYIRHWFYEYLDMFIAVIVPLCQRAIEAVNDTPEGEEIMIPQIINDFSNEKWAEMMTLYQNRIRKQATPTHFVHKSGIKYGKKINDKHLVALLNGLDNSIRKIIQEQSLAEYIYDIIYKSLSFGGSFLKNDINDALILSSLNRNSIILSFDNGMIEHMKKRAENRPEYQRSLDFIETVQHTS